MSKGKGGNNVVFCRSMRGNVGLLGATFITSEALDGKSAEGILLQSRGLQKIVKDDVSLGEMHPLKVSKIIQPPACLSRIS